ncbi:MAG: hypothetical protein FWH02_07060 [Oscillospiraceae bacterium]|nr:hypothetical protein [Oscillospiraceae bacterium]
MHAIEFNTAFLFFGWLLRTVLRAILTPIMELVGFLIRTIIGPILQLVLPPVIQFAIDLILTILASVFYTILKSLLEIVLVIEGAFKIFAGIGVVTYDGRQTDLLRLFVLDNSELSSAFWLITFMCLALCLIFTMYAVLRSTLDFDFENKRSVGKILGALGKACITFLLIPFFVMFSIMLTNIVMVQVYNITSKDDLTVADTIFQISGMTANKDAKYNLGPKQTFTEGMRAEYNTGGDLSWKNIDDVRKNFHLNKFDYIIGYGLSIFMIIIFATIAFTFIQRLFEIMLLYLAAPFFVSTMPMDDGAKFGAWRSMFIAKLVSGMGVIVMMNLFLLAIPVVMHDDLRLDTREEALNPANMTYNYLLKIVFVAGGALAVKKGGTLLTTLVDYQAGAQEQQTMQESGILAGRAVSFTGGMALGAGRLAMKPVAFGGKMALRGVQYGLTKKMMSGGDNPDGVSKFLRSAYSAGSRASDMVDSAKEGMGRVRSFASGDFAGAFKIGGEDTYESKRASAFMSGNMVEFMRMEKDEGKIRAGFTVRDSEKQTARERSHRPWEGRN